MALLSNGRVAESSFAAQAGDVLGRYELLLHVGTGGMAKVWAARLHGELGIGKTVAVKIALPHLTEDPKFEQLFLDEARIASAIQHPNVCGLYELGEEQDTLYLVMEWVDGASLHDLLKALPDHRLDPPLAARLIAQACSGLHAAHDLTDEDGQPLGVVHRDISPQNLLLTRTGHVKVADFGVARARGQLHQTTVTGEVKGKISYMPPEQLIGKAIDRRADIYSLGCVLYEATVGRRPHDQDTQLSTMYAILEAEIPRPSELVPGYPTALETIVMKALSRSPSERYETAEDMRFALERWLAERKMVITEADVAQALLGALAEKINERDERLKLAIEGKLVVEDEPSLTHMVLEPKPRRKTRLYGLAAFGAATVLITAALVTRSLLSGPPSAAIEGEKLDAAHAEVPAPVTERLAGASRGIKKTIEIALTADAPDAMLTIDDQGEVKSPHVLKVEPDGSVHEVKASAPGRLPAKTRVVFDESKSVTLELGRQTQARTTHLASAPPRASAQELPSKEAMPAEPAAPAPLQPSRTPFAKARPSRDIDKDNPF